MLKEVVIEKVSHIHDPESKSKTFCKIDYYKNNDFILSAHNLDDIRKGKVCSECVKKAEEFNFPKEKMKR